MSLDSTQTTAQRGTDDEVRQLCRHQTGVGLLSSSFDCCFPKPQAVAHHLPCERTALFSNVGFSRFRHAVLQSSELSGQEGTIYTRQKAPQPVVTHCQTMRWYFVHHDMQCHL
ncbi:hypothetical protein HRR83_004157 [Exophiala dermatitidis]|uniref:Uncharacterized protein n=1 Tax=Exophiala dermatitidis TaxID=5970 RepID=A0AAN6IUH8_EXODE|nr:hypothetical protein HRR73_007800 [Exophiala dermatitidis]KAJ4521539.1 hypothetical protein HRR74_003363 [Exophiala dermatitidis]KAJ4533380.1 hypothetical protein HRR77_008727 [Exophiala dermatitidis]KAJ4544982.1 hypothetical protein HRR76_003015 [Exophiala dermatitidis]KAJ4554975.1 hypothetical protein HRR79_009088 [Exophiala dermatitidis]